MNQYESYTQLASELATFEPSLLLKLEALCQSYRMPSDPSPSELPQVLICRYRRKAAALYGNDHPLVVWELIQRDLLELYDKVDRELTQQCTKF